MNRRQGATLGGVVVFVVGLIGEVIWYGEVYEMLMWGGLVVLAVLGLYQIWGSK